MNGGTADNRGLSRLEIPASATFGWQVRIQRQGVKHSRFFSDRSHGGWEPALAAAKRWRDALVEKLDGSATGSRTHMMSPRNTSGVVGVAKTAIRSPNGATYEYWSATWSLPSGERRSIRFSILRHGHDAAFRLAVEARRAGVRGKP